MDNNIPMNGPKTATFQMRINPEVKQRAEELFGSYGLTLTDAFNVFLRQSLNTGGLPFILSPDNEEYRKAQAWKRLMEEVEHGFRSMEEHGCVTLEELEAELGLLDDEDWDESDVESADA